MNPEAIHSRDLCSEQQHTHTQASVVAHCISAAAHRKCNDQSLIAALTTTDGDLAFLPHPSLHHQHLSSSSSNKSLWGASPSSLSRTRVPSSDHPFGLNGSPPCICTCTHHSFFILLMISNRRRLCTMKEKERLIEWESWRDAPSANNRMRPAHTNE